MKLKSLLLGSAAALVAVSGARAADAVIIPEPEVVEYVRVCDAAGTGYFYIPGTETCLKIGGYARFQINTYSESYDGYDYDYSGANFFSRASLQVSSWTDSEYGPVTTYFEYHMDSDKTSTNPEDAYVDAVYFTIAGVKMGYFGGFLDNGINGETDSSGLNDKYDAIQYTGTAGAVSFGVSIDEINKADGGYIYLGGDYADYYGIDGSHIGIEAMLGFSAGAVDVSVIGFYDTFAESFGVNARVSADVGPGTLQARGIWVDSDSSMSLYSVSDLNWVAEVSYAMPVGEKLTLTPGFSYREWYDDDTMWKAGLTADYNLTDTLAIKGSVQYFSYDEDYYGDYYDSTGWEGMLRFTASF